MDRQSIMKLKYLALQSQPIDTDLIISTAKLVRFCGHVHERAWYNNHTIFNATENKSKGWEGVHC